MTDAASHSRLAGLDGLRALAVALVVVYHLFPGSALAGGFVGVDVFFVISGFLITALLLREHDATGRIALGDFWRRRARRLLPALALVVLVCATAAWVIGGDLLVGLGAQILGAATFSYNWTSIAGGTGYFADASPELFRNVWSLAVEEQFYLVWPLLLPLFLLLPRARGRAALALTLAGASAAWMTALVATGSDVTRAYFGTDTHAFGLLIGVAIAFALQRPLAAPPEWMLRRSARVTAAFAGAAAVAGLVAVAAVSPTDSALTFPGALLGASLLSGVAIVAGVWPGSPFGAALDRRPLAWIGARSYGIYLWHWPILLLLLAAAGEVAVEVPTSLGAAALVLTIAAAEVSYRWVEMPVRRRGFRASAEALGRRFGGTPAARFRAIAVVVAGAVMLGGTSAAIAAAPESTSAQAAVSAGAAALDRAEASAGDGAEAGAGGDAPTLIAPAVPSAAAPSPAPAPSPTAVTGAEITAVGDSVMLAAGQGLVERFPGIQVDAAVSRSTWAGPGILQALSDAGQLRRYVVLALGTNGPVDPASLERMAQIAGRDRQIVLVNAHAPRDWIAGVNADLAAFAAAHPGTIVADWAGAVAARPELLAGDGIHPGADGGRLFAEVVADAVAQAEAERAMREHRADRWAQALLRLTLPAGA